MLCQFQQVVRRNTQKHTETFSVSEREQNMLLLLLLETPLQAIANRLSTEGHSEMEGKVSFSQFEEISHHAMAVRS